MKKKRELDLLATVLLGIERRSNEADYQLRERCARKLQTCQFGSLATLDDVVVNAIYEHAPVYADAETVKLELAMHWLRPPGLSWWGRIRWAVRLFAYAVRL